MLAEINTFTICKSQYMLCVVDQQQEQLGYQQDATALDNVSCMSMPLTPVCFDFLSLVVDLQGGVALDLQRKTQCIIQSRCKPCHEMEHTARAAGAHLKCCYQHPCVLPYVCISSEHSMAIAAATSCSDSCNGAACCLHDPSRHSMPMAYKPCCPCPPVDLHLRQLLCTHPYLVYSPHVRS